MAACRRRLRMAVIDTFEASLLEVSELASVALHASMRMRDAVYGDSSKPPIHPDCYGHEIFNVPAEAVLVTDIPLLRFVEEIRDVHAEIE
jgi:hypothetical protein